MNQIQIRLKLFGAFRKYEDGTGVEVRIEPGTRVLELKKIISLKLREIAPEFKNENLIFDSAIATEAAILSDDALLFQDSEIAVLPPVCGG